MVERIKRAMELARQERESVATGKAATSPAAEAAARAAAASAAAEAADAAAVTARAVANEAMLETAPNGAATPVLAPAGDPGDAGRTITVSDSTLEESRLLKPGMVGDAAHGFRLLRTQVLQRMQARGWNTLAVLSPGPDEGKTFTAINLAIAIAANRDSTALLVDLDLRFPRIYRRLGFLPTAGIEDCLRGQAKLSDALVAVEGYPSLMLLPARGPVAHSSELISGATARALFREIKVRYPNRIVIYDLPPVLATDDAISFLPQVDAALMVVGDGRTHRDDLLRCLEMLKDTPILGTVLNGSRRERSAEYAY
jgi:Mrp family chromosome partitioning ATPase